MRNTGTGADGPAGVGRRYSNPSARPTAGGMRAATASGPPIAAGPVTVAATASTGRPSIVIGVGPPPGRLRPNTVTGVAWPGFTAGGNTPSTWNGRPTVSR